MTQQINRYSLDKEFVSNGVLTVTSQGQVTNLNFKDATIEINSSEMYHPIVALESLRLILENDYASIIGCNGCRIDTSYRATGGYGTYKITKGQPATESLSMFEPTDELDKLCTVKEHKMAYKDWIDDFTKK